MVRPTVRILLLQFLIGLFYAAAATAQDEGSTPYIVIPTRTPGYDQLQAFARTYSVTSLDPRADGTIKSTRGIFTDAVSPDKFEETLYSFLESHQDIFGIKSPREEMLLEEIDRLKSTKRYAMSDAMEAPRTILRYHQVFRGIPVHAAWIRARFDSVGILTRVWMNYHPGIELSVEPAISAEAAVGTLGWEFVKEPSGTERSLEIVFYPDGKAHLAWSVNTETAGACFIDAHTGDSLYCEKYAEASPIQPPPRPRSILTHFRA